MTMTIELSDYEFAVLSLAASKAGVSVEEYIVSFFESGCNAPSFLKSGCIAPTNFGQEVHCTLKAVKPA